MPSEFTLFWKIQANGQCTSYIASEFRGFARFGHGTRGLTIARDGILPLGPKSRETPGVKRPAPADLRREAAAPWMAL